MAVLENEYIKIKCQFSINQEQCQQIIEFQFRNQRSTTSDWNQSAKNVKVVSDEASGSQQGAPPDSSADTESNVQDTSTNHQNIATSSQESPKSQSQTSTQGEEVTSDNKNQDVLSQQAAGPGHGESALQQDDKNQYVLSKQAAGPGHEESAVQEDNIPQQSGASFPNLGGKFENDEDREIYYSCGNIKVVSKTHTYISVDATSCP